MSANLIGYSVQLILVVGLAIAVYRLIRPSLGALLDQLLALPAGTEFFLRALLLLLMFAGLQEAVGDRWNHEPGTAFMEYVWDIASTLGNSIETVYWFIVIFLVLMTILTSVLRRRHAA